MQLASRPWTTTGVVLAGASLITATPAAAPPHAQLLAVQLTAFDPLTEWETVLQTAQSNATDIWTTGRRPLSGAAAADRQPDRLRRGSAQEPVGRLDGAHRHPDQT